MKSLSYVLFTLLLVIFIASSCPQWKCANEQEKRDSYCYWLSQNQSIMYAGPKCSNQFKSRCYLLDYLDYKDQEQCQETLFQNKFTYYKSEYCNSTLRQDLILDFQCSKYCETKGSKTNCFFKNYLESLRIPNTTIIEGECELDSQCASGKCSCAFEASGKGRCTYSKKEDDFEQI